MIIKFAFPKVFSHFVRLKFGWEVPDQSDFKSLKDHQLYSSTFLSHVRLRFNTDKLAIVNLDFSHFHSSNFHSKIWTWFNIDSLAIVNLDFSQFHSLSFLSQIRFRLNTYKLPIVNLDFSREEGLSLSLYKPFLPKVRYPLGSDIFST